LFCDPGKWHCAHTGAFAVFVFVCVDPVEEFQGLRGCGAFTMWQREHGSCAPPPEKLLPWQIWQEANPELPGAFLAVAPCPAGVAQFATGLW
jgi:hypothetical protein